MKIIGPVVHSVLDYLLVLFLWLSPTIFNFGGTVAIAVYIAGFLHFLLTICTISPLGLLKGIPFRIHGWFEAIFSVLLILLPWILGFYQDFKARNYCLATGSFLLVFWYLSSYHYFPKRG